MPSDEKPGPNLVALRDAREQAIAQLSDAFAHDLIEVEEFERRVTLAHRSSSVTDVERTVSDLVAPNPSVITVSANAPRPLLGSEQETDKVLAIFRGVERRGTWTLPRRRGLAMMGGVAVQTRLPGESEGDAHRRRRRDRRALGARPEPKRLRSPGDEGMALRINAMEKRARESP